MLSNGVYLAPSQYETLFVSAMITPELVDDIVAAHGESLIESLKEVEA